ncbi:Ig-like domain-containing protein, partial [Comamonas nitrativorans]
MDAGPTVESIVRQSPSFETTNADSVTFRVTFSEGVTGVTGSSFVIAPGSVSGATIQLVQQVDGAGTQYDVVVSGLSGTGTLNIDLATESGVMSNDGNSRVVTETNPATGKPDHSYTIDGDINSAYVGGLTGGSVQGSNIATRDTTGLEFSGKADAGDTVRLYIGNKLLGTAKADGNGDWSLTYTGAALAEGSHTLIIRSNDAAGNTATATATLAIDTTAPVVTGSITSSDIIVELTYSEALREGSLPQPGDFTVTGTVSGIIGVSKVVVDGNTVRLILTAPLKHGESVTLTYTGNGVQDLVGNSAPAITNVAVDNSGTKDASTEEKPVVDLPTGKHGTDSTDKPQHQFYSKDEAAKNVFNGGVTLTDNDDDYLESVTITITGNNNGGDTLTIDETNGPLPKGISVEINENANGTLTLKLSGHATKADYEAALNQVLFSTSTGFAEADKRMVTLVVSDGQKTSDAVTRYIRTTGKSYGLGETETAYLVDQSTGSLKGVNLVMNTLDSGKAVAPDAILKGLAGGGSNGFANGGSLALNALAFSSVDGTLYAFTNATKDGGRYVVRIDADGMATIVAKSAGSIGNSPGTGSMISADIDGDGIMYMHASGNGTIYRLDTNPESDSYGQWLAPLAVKGGNNNKTDWVDMAFNHSDGHFYAVGSNKLYKLTIDNSANTITAETLASGLKYVTNKNTGATEDVGSSFPMQYFDTDGYFYFAAGSSKQIFRVDVENPPGSGNPPSGGTVSKVDFATSTPGSGDAARDVTIHLDYGDATTSHNNTDYKTSFDDDGARHNQLNNQVWLGNSATNNTTYESDANPVDGSDDGIARDKNGNYVIPALRQGMTEYSINIAVTNKTGTEATLVGWIDFNGDGIFSVDESVTVKVPANHKAGDTVKVTWKVAEGNMPSSLDTITTFARFRITSQIDSLADFGGDPWMTTPSNSSTEDKRSYGARMDGEVEDYQITIQGPDDTPPSVSNMTVSDGSGSGPRYTPVGEVTITFTEPVQDVGVNDFVLLRDGVPVPLPPDTPVWQDPDDPAIWYIDLSKVTSPTGDYELLVPNGQNAPAGEHGVATIKDDAGNDLATGGSVKFKIDNTAPLIDLDSGDDTTRDHTTGYTADQSGAVSLDNSTPNREATVEEKSDRVTHIDIAVGGLRDGDSEVLVFGTLEFKANGSDVSTDPDNPTTTTIGGVEVVITYAAGKFTLTPVNAGGAENQVGEMSAADAQAIVRAISYKNDAGTGATNGSRTFSFTATDKAGATATPAVATVNVTGGNGQNGPDVPTVDKQITNDTTPTITGEAKVPEDGKLTVTVKVDPDDPNTWQTYEWNEANPDPDGPLQFFPADPSDPDNPKNNTWELKIPDGDDIPEGKYSVTASVTPDGGTPVDDLTDHELIIDLTPPDAPAVPDQQTHDTTPVINGTADVRDGEKLTVSVVIGGKTYTYTEGTTEGDKYLKRDNNIWSLQVPSDAPMSVGEYEVTATVKDAAGNVSDEAKGKVTIVPVVVTDPIVNESSGHAVFEVTVRPETNMQLRLEEIANSATGGGTDFGTATGTGLEYFDGTSWVAYTAGAKVAADSSGKLLVRTPITNDNVADDGEQFKLIVTPVYGSDEAITDNTGEGTATIKDDGTGDLLVENPDFDPNEPVSETNKPLIPGTPGQPVNPANPDGPKVPELDDDRELTVSGGTVNEGSDYGSFVVGGAEGQKVKLELVDGAAKGGTDDEDKSGATDFIQDLEYFDGTQWQSYTPGEYVEIPEGGKLWVRVPVVNDDLPEGEHGFKLKATNTGGGSEEGTITIDDEGQGDLLIENPDFDPNEPVSETNKPLIPGTPGQPVNPANPDGPKVPELDDD